MILSNVMVWDEGLKVAVVGGCRSDGTGGRWQW